MRLSRNRLLSRAPARRSPRRRLSWVSWRTCARRAVVLGDGPRDAVLGQVGLQVADAAEQLADPAALGGDLAVCPLELALGVERAFPPGAVVRRGRGGASGQGGGVPGVPGGRGGDQCPGLGVLVEERAGYPGFSELDHFLWFVRLFLFLRCSSLGASVSELGGP